MDKLYFRAPKVVLVIFFGFVLWFTTELVGEVLRLGGPPPVLSYILFLIFSFMTLTLHLAQGRPMFYIATLSRTRNVWIWLFAFLIWIQVNYIFSSQSENALQRLITGSEMILIFIAVFWFMTTYRLQTQTAKIMVLVTIFGSALNIYDFFDPIFTAFPGRAAGLYENPTIAGFMLILSMSVGFGALGVKYRWALLILVGIAVFFTFSRSSWLIFAFSIVWFAWKNYLGGKAARYLLAAIAVGGVTVFGAAMLSGNLANFVADSFLGAYLDSDTLARLGGQEFGTDFSARERQAVAQLAISAFMQGDNPVLGYGIGHTFEWNMSVSTHNVYLLFLVEGGIIGFTIFLSFLIILWKSTSGIGRLMVIQVSIQSFFDHNLFDTPGRIIFLALIAANIFKFDLKTSAPNVKVSSGNASSHYHGPKHRRGRAVFT